MAKKFVKVTGLNKVFTEISTTGAASIKSGVTVADANSILYITATADDSEFSAPYNVDGSHWIWAQGQLYDGNTAALARLSNVAAMDGNIAATDSLETIVRKLIKKVGDAEAAGVTSLTTTDDAWVTVDPDLNSSTGAVKLKLAHGGPGSTSDASTKGGATSAASTWGAKATVTIPTVGIDEKGHVALLNTSTFDVVTLPAKPVTTLTTSGDAEVIATTLSKVTGDVTVEVKHAEHTAVKAGETANKTLSLNSSSFKVLEVSTNGTGHVISANARTITLPNTAFSDTTYTFGDGVQSFTYKKGTDASVTVKVDHQTITAATASATDGTYVSSVLVDDYGHVKGQASKTNGVYSDDSTSHAAGELAVWDGATNKLKTSDKTILSGDISATSDTSASTIPTVAQVVKYVLENKVAGAMTYKGTISSKTELPETASTGDTYLLDTSVGTYQQGDMFIYNASSTATDKWDYIPAGNTPVSDLNPAMVFGQNSSIATIEGVTIHATLPSETALSVTTDATKEASGITYVSSVTKGTNSHDLTIKKADIRTATNTLTGIVKLVNSSNNEATDAAATTKAVKDVKDLAASKSTVAYSQTVASTAADSYEIGKITIDGAATTIYGVNTVYTHPKAPATGSVTTTTTGGSEKNNVVTGISRDASGHIATVTTSNISDAYNQRTIKVNGTELIATDKTTALNIAAGSNVTLTSDTTAGKVTIAAADEKVKATASEDKICLLGQTTTTIGSAATANFDADVYTEGGSLHATALYEGAWSIHDSSAGDWGTI